jgi:glutamate racemase
VTIGLFDSGAGGLSVLHSLQARMPQQDFIYLADTAHFPYGAHDRVEISRFAEEAIAFLIEKGAERVVVACHTASIHLELRQWPVPVTLIIEPTVRACLPFNRVGVIATKSTIASGTYQRLLGERCTLALPCPKLVQMAEKGAWNLNIAEQELAPFRGKVDALLLGCTHYGLVRDEIQNIVGTISLIGAEAIDVEPTTPGTGSVSYFETCPLTA